MLDKFEKALRRDFQLKIRALREKAEEFRVQGDLSRAARCLFLAKYLKEFMEKELNAFMG